MAEIPTYRAKKDERGNWRIYDVPVFAVHTDDRGSKPIEFDAAWLRKALKQAQTRESEGYLPPLHVRHHGDPKGADAAGKFRLTRLGTIRHDGEDVAALFADLVDVSPEIYAEIQRGKLAYRSVEILDVDSPELDSLALLSDEVPYFRFPLLQVKEATAAGYALAYRADDGGRGASVLFRFGGPDMATETVTLEAEPEVTKAEAEPETYQEPDTQDLAAVLASFGETLSKILAAVSKEEDEDEEKDTDDEPENAAEMATRSADDRDKQAGQLAALVGRLEALEAQNLTLREDAQAADAVSKARHRRVSEETLRTFTAQRAERGLAFAAGWLENQPGCAVNDPPALATRDLPPRGPVDPPEVQAYAALGPDALDRARSIARQHANRSAAGMLSDANTLENYLRVNYAAETTEGR